MTVAPMTPPGSDWTSAIHDAISGLGPNGGVVQLPDGTLEHTGLTIPSNVVLRGEGARVTILRLANGSNTHSVQSEGFAALTGTSAWWAVDDSVPTSFGLESLTIDGNKANNTTGHGVAFYGKRWHIDDVVIHDAKGDGLYAECGDIGGQSVLDDLPESTVGKLWVKWSGGDGVRWRGPHDGIIQQLVTAGNAGAGFRCQTSAGVYSGAVNLKYIHAYGNDQGVLVETNLNAETVETESNFRHGLVVSSTASESVFGIIKAFKNWQQDSVAGTAQANPSIDINARTTIGAARIRTDYGGTGVLLRSGAGGSVLPGLLINGEFTNGLGLDVDANRVQVRADISGFTATGGIGARVGASAGRHQTMLDLTLTANKLGLQEVTAGNRNRWRALAFSDAGQTSFDVKATGSGNERDLVTN